MDVGLHGWGVHPGTAGHTKVHCHERALYFNSTFIFKASALFKLFSILFFFEMNKNEKPLEVCKRSPPFSTHFFYPPEGKQYVSPKQTLVFYLFLPHSGSSENLITESKH